MSFFNLKGRKIQLPLKPALVILLLQTLFLSCRLFSEAAEQETLSISLPSWPPASCDYPPLSRWKITLAKCDETTSFYAEAGDTIKVTVSRNSPFSLQAQPLTLLNNGCECLYFHPAGFIYPSSSKRQAVWEEGYAACLMEGLYKSIYQNGFSGSEAARYVSSFNWQKMLSLLREKIEAGSLEDEKSYNPWLCDTGKIIKNLSEESFRASLLSPSACYQLSTEKLSQDFNLSPLSPFIPENSSLWQKKEITIKKGSPLLLSDAKEFGLFITYLSAKNVQIEYIYIPIYKEEI